MISEWSKIDLRTRMTKIIEEEVTTDRTTTTGMAHLLFSLLARQRTRLKWRISEINSRNSMIPRSRGCSGCFPSSTRILTGNKCTEIRIKIAIRKKKRDNNCLLTIAS